MTAGTSAAAAAAAAADWQRQIAAGFERCFSGIAEMECPLAPAVIVAVSGGSDSIALLLLAQAYFKQYQPGCRLIAVTIDHQLRPESAKEAQDVAAFCAKIGVRHQILCWNAPKPPSGLAEAARNARYDLLVAAAQTHHAAVILTGHTADDQVETYLMRQQRQADGKPVAGDDRGLAAMAPQTLLHNSILLCRPLLRIWRAALREFLHQQNTRWIDDPSNDNLAYERPRIRRLARQADQPALLQAVEQAGLQRRITNQQVVALLQELLLQNREGQENKGQASQQEGEFLLLPDDLLQRYSVIAPLSLAYVLAAIGGKALLPPVRDCAALLRDLRQPAERSITRRTLHHCVLEQSRDGLTVRREARNLPVLDLEPGQSGQWDGRYRIENHSTQTLRIAPASAQMIRDYWKKAGEEGAALRLKGLLTQPAVFHDGCLISLYGLGAVPQTLPVRFKRSPACFDSVLSGYDFEVMRVMKALLTKPINHNYS